MKIMLGRFAFEHEFKNKFGTIKAVVPRPTDLRNSLRVVFMDSPFEKAERIKGTMGV